MVVSMGDLVVVGMVDSRVAMKALCSVRGG